VVLLAIAFYLFYSTNSSGYCDNRT